MTLVLFCGLELVLRRSRSITDDWQGWRQADTQAIARNLAFEELDPLRPRIDWRGDGPGYVETELQIYATLIAVAMRAFGESEWPGQLVSLVSVALAAAILAATLARRFGRVAGYGALLAVLSSQGVIVAGTSIQPDALAFLAFTIGFCAFADWLETEAKAQCAMWIVMTTIAALVKPTTLELGIAQAVLVLLTKRDALRRRWLFVGWAIVILATVAALVNARGLYLTYGNTFGILSGGDSKLPISSAALKPSTLLGLVRFFVVWGIGLPGAFALGYLLRRRRVGPEEKALLAGAAVLSIVALRYVSGPWGTHYHLPHVVLGAWLVARMLHDVAQRWRYVGVVGIACAALLTARAIHWVRTRPVEPESTLGRMLAESAKPGTLVVVRARSPRWDAEWRTVNNFEDPRIFYLSRTHGWVLAHDDAGATRLADAAKRGARFYVNVRPLEPDTELQSWLAANAEIVALPPEGQIYRITSASTSSSRGE